MSRQVPHSERSEQRWLWRRLLLAVFVFLVPFADPPVSADPQLAGIFDNSGDFDDDFDEIGLSHVVQAAANEGGAFDPPLRQYLHFAPVVSGPAPAAWPGLSPDERAPPRV
jgi:hypothetical protein